ncbi:DNA-binding response regulator, NarL/FixJ family, contains REC and HTH domains [Geodermatophilus amargosae]|uniref:DNA-binding response regulator, NarL/FixJ family, contains REC and HTH domains n=2 Tax=Geodermatophilus amargosae TaxID=1296565 RepID=A0A1I7D727_9ACTN|nr:DNA-binding response regulator, NarL/FixJ family, contains REC and HTH domains [Geodermatophilus amargosae]
MFRDGLVSLLRARRGTRVVAAVGTGREAVLAAVKHQPHVAVADLRMPDGDGTWVNETLRERTPAVRVLVLTSAEDDRAVQAALAAGAHGYLLETAEPAVVLAAVTAVADGATALSDDVFAGSSRRLQGRGRTARPFPELTDREFEILEQLADGRSTEDIALRLGPSPKTVRNLVSSVLLTLGARDRTAAAAAAHRAGRGGSVRPDQ